MAESFSTWYEQNKAASDMEWEIIKDKLAQGTNGVEWLVLQVLPDKDRLHSLELWIMNVKEFKKKSPDDVMIDALTMDSESFYKKHKINWWISVDDTLTFLSITKEQNYDAYLNFLKLLEKKEEGK